MELILPPGVVYKQSRKKNQLNWREVNLLRWENDTLEPVGGWETLTYDDFDSNLRKMHRWVANDGTRITAFLCEEHCYVDLGDGSLTDITPIGGLTPPDNTAAGGFGDSTYGTATYGEPRDAADRFDATTPMFSLDNWGEELRVMTSADGRLLRWSPQTPSTALVAVANAPTDCRCFVVTPERHIILFGPDADKGRYEWCDEEDDTNWTASSTSKAGGYNIEPYSPIVTARVTPFGVVVFTNRGGYIIRYIGLPYVYEKAEEIAKCPPPYSPDSLINTPQGLFWAAINGFWVYNGVTATPVQCPIWDWIEKNIQVMRTRFWGNAITILTKFENWWFFTSGEVSTANTVVIYNYLTGSWSMGKLERVTGVSIPSDPFPLLANKSTVYQHESGWKYPDAEELPWGETFTMNSTGGIHLTTLKQMLPEVLGDPSAVQFRFIKRDNPNDDAPETTSDIKTIRSNGYVDIRETARQLRMRVEMIGNAAWSLGNVNLDLARRGQK